MGTFVGAGTFTEKSSGTTIALPLPAGAQSGDLCVAVFACNSATVVGTQSSPAFTTILSHSSTGDTVVPDAWIGRRTLSAGDVTTGSVTLNNVPSAAASGQALVLRDFTTTQDFTAVFLDKTATNTANFAFGAQTISSAGSIGIYVVVQNSATGPTAPATSYTEDGDRVSGRNVEVAHRIYSSAGTTGAITPVMDANTRGVGLLIALQPSATGTPQTGDAAQTATLTGSSSAAVARSGDASQTATVAPSSSAVLTRVVDAPSPTAVVNLVPNPSFEVDATGWSGGSATTTVVQTGVQSGVNAARVTGTGSVALSTPTGASGIPVTPGLPYTASAYISGTKPSAAVRLNFYTSGGAFVSPSAVSSTVTLTSTPTRASASAVAPASAAFAAVLVATDTDVSANYVQVDAVMLTPTSAAVDYFDGGLASSGVDAYSWSGTPNGSSSTHTVYAIGLTATATATTTLGGSAAQTATVTPTASATAARPADASTTATLAASATATVPRLADAATTATLTATADSQLTRAAAAAQTVTLVASSAATSAKPGDASQTATLAATSAATGSRAATASQTASLTATASATVTRPAGASAAISLTTTADGSVSGQQHGVATQTATVAPTAAATATRAGSATQAAALAPTATGTVARTVDAATAVALTPTAAATPTRPVDAAAALALTAAADADAARTADADTALALDTTADADLARAADADLEMAVAAVASAVVVRGHAAIRRPSTRPVPSPYATVGAGPDPYTTRTRAPRHGSAGPGPSGRTSRSTGSRYTTKEVE